MLHCLSAKMRLKFESRENRKGMTEVGVYHGPLSQGVLVVRSEALGLVLSIMLSCSSTLLSSQKTTLPDT